MSDRSAFLDHSVTVASLIFWAGIVAYALSQQMPRARFGIAFLGGTLTIYVLDELNETVGDARRFEQPLLAAAVVIVLATTGYMFFNFDVLYSVRVGYALDYEYALAVAFIGTMIGLTYRSYGGLFLAILVVAILYGLFGNTIPGVLGHGGISTTRMIRILVLEINGFFGLLTRLVGAWLALFLLYAGFLEAFGGFDLMIRIAVRSAKYIRSGVAQSAVVASMIIGSINGSTAANTAMTGSFTIPLMKKNGIRSETAAGIEAVASTVGQVLPPVMGAGAFIMASLLGIDYVDVIVAGTVPAIVMVVSIAVGVHYTSIGQIGAGQVDVASFVDGTRTPRALLVDGVRFLIPFVVLVYTLGIAQFTVITAALYTSTAMAVTGVAFPVAASALGIGSSGGGAEGFGSNADAGVSTASVNDSTLGTLVEQLGVAVDGARKGAVSLAGIAIIIAAINGVVTILLTTGIPSALTLALIDLSGGIMLVAVVLSMGISIILGLGMPTAAAYLIVALLIAPTLINQFAVPELAAHFFVFYSAILAAITPPIATSVAVAAGIADSDFWRTSHEALKVATPLFILPFAFVYNPNLVNSGFGPTVALSAGLVLVGGLSITHGLNYVQRPFGLSRAPDLGIRFLYVLVGVVAMAVPAETIRITAAAVFVGVFALQRVTRPPADEPAAVGH